MKKFIFSFFVFLLSITNTSIVFSAGDQPNRLEGKINEIFPVGEETVSTGDASTKDAEILHSLEKNIERARREIEDFKKQNPERILISPEELALLFDEIAKCEQDYGKGSPECDDEKKSFNDANAKNDAYIKKLKELNKKREATKLKLEQFQAQLNRTHIRPKGMIGSNCDGNFLLDFLPVFINIILKIIAPIVLIMLIYSGIKFIYSGDNESEIEKSKTWFGYAVIGILLIILSYTIMKSTYFIFSTSEEEQLNEKFTCTQTITEEETIFVEGIQTKPAIQKEVPVVEDVQTKPTIQEENPSIEDSQ